MGNFGTIVFMLAKEMEGKGNNIKSLAPRQAYYQKI